MTNDFTLDALPAAVRDFKPEVGLVLGSGLGGFIAELMARDVVPYGEIGGLPVSKVPGHAGRFVLAQIGNRRCLIAAGRVHLYEGWSAAEVTAGVRCMAAAGITRLVLTNAAGAANPAFPPGTWMMLNDHLNLTGTTPLLGGANFFDMTSVYSEEWRQQFAATAVREGITLHEGVYAGLLGPQYETPAEVRMLRLLGADAIGMSTVLEAIQARALGLDVAAFSCLTNWGSGIGNEPLSHGEVLDTGLQAAGQLSRMLIATFSED